VGRTIGALFYLRTRSLRNAVISRFKRLKQPKYLVGGVVGAAYVYFFFVRRMTAGRPVGSGGLTTPFPVERLPMVAALGALLLMFFVALYWLWPRARAALTFSEAEIAFLFPAPISRRTLIHYRWINAQLRILFTALILGLVSGGWGFVPGNAGIRILGWWLILSTLDLHSVGSSFAITKYLDRGTTSLRRILLTLAVVAIAAAVASVATWRSLHAPTAEDMVDAAAVMNYLAMLLATRPLSWLLLPATWVIRPVLATDLRSFIAALGPALLVYAAHYVWVLRAEVSFEEASIAKAEKRAARRTAVRAGTLRIGTARKARRAPFKLSSARRPELAFLWKNLLASADYMRPRTALIAAAIIVVGSNWLARADHEVIRGVVSVSAAVAAAYTLFFGPLVARHDLRHDLPNVDILKTYPLRGWQVVLGEVLTPVAIVTALLWLMLLTAALTFQPPAVEWLTPGQRFAAVIGLALLTPLICSMQVVVMNAAVVLFPAWIPMGAARPSGIDVLGQRIFFLAALYLTVLVALLPAAIAAAAAFFASLWVVGAPLATALAALLLLTILSIEIAVAISWLGRRFENFDLSAELRP
jgi:hypothetical protein